MSGKIIKYRYLDSRGKMRFHSIRTSGLFTGKKDIKGKEIYEDDIVRHKSGLGKELGKEYKWCVGVICFRDGGFFIDYSGRGEIFRYLDSIEKVKIIGNMDENPGLLEK